MVEVKPGGGVLNGDRQPGPCRCLFRAARHSGQFRETIAVQTGRLPPRNPNDGRPTPGVKTRGCAPVPLKGLAAQGKLGPKPAAVSVVLTQDFVATEFRWQTVSDA